MEGIGVPRDEARGLQVLSEIESLDPRGVRLERVRRLWFTGDHEAWRGELDSLVRLARSEILAHRWGELAIHLFEVVPALDEASGLRQWGLNRLARLLMRAAPLRSFDPRIPYNLAVFLGQQEGATQRVRDLIARSALLGHVEGSYAHASTLLSQPATFEAGVRAVRLAGERGSAKAWRHLAALRSTGLLLPDEPEVLRCLLRAAELGDQRGTLGLSARLILLGRYRDAVPCADRARRAGSLDAEADLALIRAVASPDPADAADGLARLEVLAETEARACQALFSMYRDGRGVPRDPVLARRYAERVQALSGR